MSDEDVSAEVNDLMRRLYTECDDTHRTSHINDKENQLYCPHRFDGYACWPRTIAGTTVYQQCPDFVTGFNNRLLAYKECHKNGTWYTHPETGAEWSNYTTCVDVGDLEFRQFVNEFYVIGYVLSLITQVVSLIVFLSFRSLKCTRIRIHIQLFTSLPLSCIAWLIWYEAIVESPDIIRDNTNCCILLLNLVIHYLMLANYFWMFCEGLHLHLVLVVVFVNDSVAMKWLIFIGWFAPVILVAIYAIVREYYSRFNTQYVYYTATYVELFVSLLFRVRDKFVSSMYCSQIDKKCLAVDASEIQFY